MSYEFWTTYAELAADIAPVDPQLNDFLRNVFKKEAKYCTDGFDMLSKEDFLSWLGRIGVQRVHLFSDLFDCIERDELGQIREHEFVVIMSVFLLGNQSKDLEMAMRQLGFRAVCEPDEPYIGLRGWNLLVSESRAGRRPPEPPRGMACIQRVLRPKPPQSTPNASLRATQFWQTNATSNRLTYDKFYLACEHGIVSPEVLFSSPEEFRIVWSAIRGQHSIINDVGAALLGMNKLLNDFLVPVLRAQSGLMAASSGPSPDHAKQSDLKNSELRMIEAERIDSEPARVETEQTNSEPPAVEAEQMNADPGVAVSEQRASDLLTQTERCSATNVEREARSVEKQDPEVPGKAASEQRIIDVQTQTERSSASNVEREARPIEKQGAEVQVQDVANTVQAEDKQIETEEISQDENVRPTDRRGRSLQSGLDDADELTPMNDDYYHSAVHQSNRTRVTGRGNLMSGKTEIKEDLTTVAPLSTTILDTAEDRDDTPSCSDCEVANESTSSDVCTAEVTVSLQENLKDFIRPDLPRDSRPVTAEPESLPAMQEAGKWAARVLRDNEQAEGLARRVLEYYLSDRHTSKIHMPLDECFLNFAVRMVSLHRESPKIVSCPNVQSVYTMDCLNRSRNYLVRTLRMILRGSPPDRFLLGPNDIIVLCGVLTPEQKATQPNDMSATEIALITMALKIAFPDNVVLIRGKHEMEGLDRTVYGGLPTAARLAIHNAVGNLLEELPVGCVLGRQVFVYGGRMTRDLVNVLPRLLTFREPIYVETRDHKRLVMTVAQSYKKEQDDAKAVNAFFDSGFAATILISGRFYRKGKASREKEPVQCFRVNGKKIETIELKLDDEERQLAKLLTTWVKKK